MQDDSVQTTTETTTTVAPKIKGLPRRYAIFGMVLSGLGWVSNNTDMLRGLFPNNKYANGIIMLAGALTILFSRSVTQPPHKEEA